MQILTKYIGPTATKPARVKAVFQHDKSKSLTLPFNHELSDYQNQAEVARQLIRTLDASHIGEVWTCLEIPSGYVFANAHYRTLHV